jgi:hypothetical protein
MSCLPDHTLFIILITWYEARTLCAATALFSFFLFSAPRMLLLFFIKAHSPMCIYSLSVCTNSLRLAYPIFAFTNIYGICVSPTTNRKELAQFSRKSILCECISGLNARAARVCNLMSLRSSGNYSSPWEMCPKIYSFEFAPC